MEWGWMSGYLARGRPRPRRELLAWPAVGSTAGMAGRNSRDEKGLDGPELAWDRGPPELRRTQQCGRPRAIPRRRNNMVAQEPQPSGLEAVGVPRASPAPGLPPPVR